MLLDCVVNMDLAGVRQTGFRYSEQHTGCRFRLHQRKEQKMSLLKNAHKVAQAWTNEIQERILTAGITGVEPKIVMFSNYSKGEVSFEVSSNEWISGRGYVDVQVKGTDLEAVAAEFIRRYQWQQTQTGNLLEAPGSESS